MRWVLALLLLGGCVPQGSYLAYPIFAEDFADPDLPRWQAAPEEALEVAAAAIRAFTAQSLVRVNVVREDTPELAVRELENRWLDDNALMVYLAFGAGQATLLVHDTKTPSRLGFTPDSPAGQIRQAVVAAMNARFSRATP